MILDSSAIIAIVLREPGWEGAADPEVPEIRRVLGLPQVRGEGFSDR